MPLFFFHVTDGEYVPDKTGADLPDVGAARKHAAILAGGLLAEHPDRFWDGQERLIEMNDQDGQTHFTLVLMAVQWPDPKRQRRSALARQYS